MTNQEAMHLETSQAGRGPARRRGQIARSRIVDAAAELFYRNGVARTGMAEIADASRTGKGQLYHYFAGKSEIVSAVIATQTDRTIQAQQTLLDSMSTPEDLHEWVRAAVSAHDEPSPARCPLGALTVGIADVDPGLRGELDEGFIRWRSQLAIGVQRLQEAGHVRTERTADEWADVLLCAYEGGLVLAEARGSLRPLIIALDAAVESMLTGPGVPRVN